MAESLFGLLCLGIILALVFFAWKNHSAKEKVRKERFQYQQAIFETWAAERFGPSEIGKAAGLRPANPLEFGLETEELTHRKNAVRGIPSNWAEEIIRHDRISRERQAEHFESWGEERFGSPGRRPVKDYVVWSAQTERRLSTNWLRVKLKP